MHGEINESSRADRDQHIGAPVSDALAVLPLGADQGVPNTNATPRLSSESKKSAVWKAVLKGYRMK